MQPFAPYIYTIIKNRLLNLLADMEKEQELQKKIIALSIDLDTETENSL